MNKIDHIDIKALQRRGIRFGYTPDILNDAGSLTHTSKNALYTSDSNLIYTLSLDNDYSRESHGHVGLDDDEKSERMHEHCPIRTGKFFKSRVIDQSLSTSCSFDRKY